MGAKGLRSSCVSSVKIVLTPVGDLELRLGVLQLGNVLCGEKNRPRLALAADSIGIEEERASTDGRKRCRSISNGWNS